MNAAQLTTPPRRTKKKARRRKPIALTAKASGDYVAPLKAGRVEQAFSKLRRYWLSKARKGYIESHLAERAGECLRCARCCAIFFKCPFLVDSKCRIYGVRFEQCRTFPIDGRDVKLITRLGGKCGYTFGNNGGTGGTGGTGGNGGNGAGGGGGGTGGNGK